MATPTGHTDVESTILATLRLGDHDGALTRILRHYGPEVQSYLLGVLRDAYAAEEVFCDVGFELWRALPTFRGECSIRTFVYRLSFHSALHYKKDPYRRRARPLEGPCAGLIAEVRSRTAPYLKSDLRSGVERLRSELDPEEQTLLTLRIDRRMSWAEVAQVLSLSEVTLRKRFERLKERLHQAAKREGLLAER